MPVAETLRSFLHRGGAVALAGLVMVLGVLARAPDAHAWLHGVHHASDACSKDGGSRAAAQADAAGRIGHGGEAGHGERGLEGELSCAVTLFAQGLPALALPPRVAPPAECAQLAGLRAPEAPCPRAAARKLPPSQGPPTRSA